VDEFLCRAFVEAGAASITPAAIGAKAIANRLIGAGRLAFELRLVEKRLVMALALSTLVLAPVTVVVRVMPVALAPSAGHFGLTAAGWSSRRRPVVLASTFFGMFAVLPGRARAAKSFGIRVLVRHRHRSCW
jgi:hypothetical protein